MTFILDELEPSIAVFTGTWTAAWTCKISLNTEHLLIECLVLSKSAECSPVRPDIMSCSMYHNYIL